MCKRINAASFLLVKGSSLNRPISSIGEIRIKQHLIVVQPYLNMQANTPRNNKDLRLSAA